MKLVIAAFALVAIVAAAPPVSGPAGPAAEPIRILRSEFNQQPDGPYNFSFESENGIQRAETGELREVPDEDNHPQQVVVVRGSYTYNDAEGHPQTITYFADETGYHAEGDNIPRPARR